MKKVTLKQRVSKSLAIALIPAQVLIGLPAHAAPAPAATDEPLTTPPPAAPNVTVNRTVPVTDKVPDYAQFSSAPTNHEISEARVFGEPLGTIDGTEDPEANKFLAKAIQDFQHGGDTEKTGPFEAYLAMFPKSPWRASLLANLGVLYRRKGYFTRAQVALTEAWQLGKDSPEPLAQGSAYRALTDLLELEMQFGHQGNLETILAGAKGREFSGAVSEKIREAESTVWGLTNHHDQAVPSGTMALKRIMAFKDGRESQRPLLDTFHATPEGASLVQMRDLARRAGLNLRIARRESSAVPMIYPAMVHLVEGHFSAAVREEDGKVKLDDPILGGEMWISHRALAEESSGLYLVEDAPLPSGWTAVSDADGRNARGKCVWAVPDGGATGQGDEKRSSCNGSGQPASGAEPEGPTGMPEYDFHLLLASLTISDVPVGYTPPRGPACRFKMIYNQREANQPVTFTFSNLGQRWNVSWLSYLEDDPSSLNQPINLRLRGGGTHLYAGIVNGVSAPQTMTRATLVRTSTSPVRYERRLADGGVEVFAQADGALAFPRRIFMTESIDPQGNKLQFIYDGQLRLTSVVDAIGQVTTLSYGLASDPRKVTQVTDPFGRSAKLEYNSAGNLIAVTDVIGLQSTFDYASDFIRDLGTPYGHTSFSTGKGPNITTDGWIEALDPLGGRERAQYVAYGEGGVAAVPDTLPAASVPSGFAVMNTALHGRNTFYWSKRKMAAGLGSGANGYGGNYALAESRHWLMYGTGIKIGGVSGIIADGGGGRVWYHQAGELMANAVGSSGRPSKIGRVLDDGTSQVNRYEYNPKGKVTRATDPVGRTTIFNYDTSGIDLLEVRQVNGLSTDLLSSYTYNSQHQPLTVTDAAGQTTTYTYFTNGNLQTIVTPPRAGLTAAERTTTFAYFADNAPAGAGLLQSFVRPSSPQGSAMAAYTYDGYGHARTITDADGYTITMDHDALDRVTKVTYPDGTFTETVFSRLDVQRQRDRLGRWTRTFRDALRRPVATHDSLDKVSTSQWCACGSLDAVSDEAGNTTKWERDLQGRITRVVRADGGDIAVTYENTTSRVKQLRDSKQQVINIQYFLDDSWKQVSYGNAAIVTPTVSFTHDPVYKRLATITDGTGTTTLSYNNVATPPVVGSGQLASVDGPLANDLTTYNYDEVGQISGLAINGVSQSVTRDSLGRVSSAVNALGTFTYGYAGPTHRLANASYPNGQSTSFSYFPNSQDKQLQEIHHQLAGGAALSRFQYTYDLEGAITSWTQQAGSNPAKAYDLEYDAVGHLVAATSRTTDPIPSILKRYRYSYDKADNRVGEQVDNVGMTASYNALNQLTGLQPGGALRFEGGLNESSTVTVQGKPAQVTPDNRFEGSATVPPGGSNVAVVATDASGNVRTNTYAMSASGSAKTLTYDANGNLTGDGTRTFEWDAVNRLAAAVEGTHRSEFTYDGWGRRVHIVEKDNGIATSDRRFLWCGTTICEERDSSGATVIRRFFGQGMQEGGAAFFYTKDHLGSVRELTDVAGTVRARYDYDPYGRITKVSGDKDSVFAFTGHMLHARSGLSLAVFRAYDADLGTWISADPIGFAGQNLYVYADGSPINRLDPLGLSAIPDSEPLVDIVRQGAKILPFIAPAAEAAGAGGAAAVAVGAGVIGGLGYAGYVVVTAPPYTPTNYPGPRGPAKPEPIPTPPPAAPGTPPSVSQPEPTPTRAPMPPTVPSTEPGACPKPENDKPPRTKNGCNCTCLGRADSDWDPMDPKHGDRTVGRVGNDAECREECGWRGFRKAGVGPQYQCK
jgi:RHS repeat-associated protein